MTDAPKTTSTASKRRHPPVKRAVRDTCLDVLESSTATDGEKLHACDLLLMLLGMGSRNGAGARVRKVKTKADAAKVELIEPKTKSRRDRLHELMHAAAPLPLHKGTGAQQTSDD